MYPTADQKTNVFDRPE